MPRIRRQPGHRRAVLEATSAKALAEFLYIFAKMKDRAFARLDTTPPGLRKVVIAEFRNAVDSGPEDAVFTPPARLALKEALERYKITLPPQEPKSPEGWMGR